MAVIGELMIRAGIEVADLVTGLAGIGKELDNFASQVDKTFSGLDKVGARMTELGTSMTAALTLPLAGIGAAAVKAAVDFDEASDRIRSKTGATGEALQGLNAVFKDVFSTLPVSVGDASEAISALAVRTGLAGKPLEDLVTQELNLARVTETAVTPLIEATTRAFGDWSIATEQQAGKLDFLFKVAQGTGINITKLTELVVQFGAPMRALGFDFETAATMLGRFEKEGVNIGAVMPGLRMAIKNFAGAGLEGAAAFQSFVDVVKNSSDAQGTLMAKTVSGGRAFVDMFRAIKEGRFDLDVMTKSFKESSETINKAAADTLSFADKLTVFKNKLETSLEPIGTVITGIFEKWLDNSKPFIQSLEDMAVGFSKLEPSTQGWILGAAAAVAAIGPLLAGLGLAVQGFAALAPVMALAVAGFTGFAVAVVNVGTAITSGLTGALTTGETVLLRFGQAAVLAAGAFAGWKLGEWAVNNIPAVGALSQAIADLLVQIPGVVTAMNYFSGATKAGAEAASSEAFAIAKLETSLKAHGITIEKAGLSAAQYRTALLDAAKGVQSHASAVEAASPKVKAMGVDLSALTSGHEKAAKATKVHGQSLDEWYQSAIKFLGALSGPKSLTSSIEAFNQKMLEAFNPTAALDKAFNHMNDVLLASGELWGKVTPQLSGALNSMLNKMVSDSIVSVAAVNKALSNFHIMSPEKAASELAINADFLATLQQQHDLFAAGVIGAQKVTDAQLAIARAKNAQDTIDTYRKTGIAVTETMEANLAKLKQTEFIATMEMGEAWKVLGVTTTKQFEDQVTIALAAYQKIKTAHEVTGQDILKADASLYSAQLTLQQANGDRVTDIQKAHLAKMQELALQGQKNWATQVDELAVDAGKAMSKGMDNIIESFLAGKLSLKKAWDEMLTELTTAFVKAFISPITKSIGDFIANTMSQLLGGKGFGGAIAAAKTLSQVLSGSGEVAKEVSGIGATVSALGGVSQVGNAVGSGEAAAGAVANATGAATQTAGGVGSALGSLAGIANIANIANAGISALSGIVSGVQQAHANSLLDKIEKSTREISTVTWQTGEESLQGLLKRIWLDTQQMVGRLVDIGTDLIEAVNANLEAIINVLRTDIYQAIQGAQGAADHGAEAVAEAVTDAGHHDRSAIDAVATATTQAGDATAAAINDANQSATAAAQAMSQGLSDVQATTADGSNGVMQAVTAGSDTVAQTVADSGTVIAAAVSNGFSIAGLTSQQMLEQLNVIGANGGAFTTAYTDAKNAVISSKTYLDDLAAQIAANQKAQADAAAKAASIGKSALQLGGFDNDGSFIPRSGDTSPLITGPQGFGPVTSPIADFSIPAQLPLISPGISMGAPNYLVPPADPRTFSPGSASYVSSKGPYAPPAYTGGLAPTINFYGNVTNDQFADQLTTKIANTIATENARNM